MFGAVIDSPFAAGDETTFSGFFEILFSLLDLLEIVGIFLSINIVGVAILAEGCPVEVPGGSRPS